MTSPKKLDRNPDPAFLVESIQPIKEIFFVTTSCPKCNSDRVLKNGIYQGRQGYVCKDCDRHFIVGDRRSLGILTTINGDSITTREIAAQAGISMSTAKNKMFEATHGVKGCCISLPIALVAKLTEERAIRLVVADAIAIAPDNIQPAHVPGDRKKMLVHLSPQSISKLKSLLRTGRFKSRNELVIACLMNYQQFLNISDT